MALATTELAGSPNAQLFVDLFSCQVRDYRERPRADLEPFFEQFMTDAFDGC